MCRRADVGRFMNDQSLNLWRQIESVRYCGKKRQWPTVTERPPKAAAND